MKTLKFRFKEMPLIYAVLLATLYFVISGITMKAAIQISCFGALIIICVISYRKIVFRQYDFIWLMSIFPFFYAVDEWTPANLRDFIAYLSFVILIVSVKCNLSFMENTIRLLFAMSVFHLVFIIVNFLFKSQYNNFIYSILAQGAVATFTEAVRGNYYTGFGYIPGDTSGYMVNGIIILLFADKLVQKKYKYVQCGLFLIGIMLCAKKSHLLCLIVTIMLVWIITASGSKKLKRIVLIALTVISICTLGYSLLPLFSGIPMMNRISVSLDQLISGRDFTSNRTNLYVLAINFYKENKLWGVGWKFFNQYTYNRWGKANYVNNVFLQLLAETGIVGFILFVTPMILCLRRTFVQLNIVRKQYMDNDKLVQFLSLSLAMQLFFLLYSIFEIPFYDYTFLLVYGIAIVISNSVQAELSENRGLRRK